MAIEIDKRTIEESLERICTHKLFSGSETNKKLLNYLVEKARIGEDLKELTIGIDLIDESYGIDKSDGAVRTYMYKLRKKLAAYYNDPETDEPIIFKIEKGQYNLSFVPVEDLELNSSESGNKSVFLILTLLAVGMIAMVALLFNGFFNTQDAIWEPFFKSDTGNLVVVSDQYVVAEMDKSGDKRAVLYNEINNDDDLLAYLKQNPDKNLSQTDYTVMSKMAPFAVNTLTNWFASNNSGFSLKLESTLTYDFLKDYNLIFIGQFKTMNLSESFFLKDSKVFSPYKDGFRYKKGDDNEVYNTRHGKDMRVEYAIVSFCSIGDNREALFFVSNNDIGTMATVTNFTQPIWLKQFRKSLPEGTHHFNALFKVSGLQRTEMNCELVRLEVLED